MPSAFVLMLETLALAEVKIGALVARRPKDLFDFRTRHAGMDALPKELRESSLFLRVRIEYEGCGKKARADDRYYERAEQDASEGFHLWRLTISSSAASEASPLQRVVRRQEA